MNRRELSVNEVRHLWVSASSLLHQPATRSSHFATDDTNRFYRSIFDFALNFNLQVYPFFALLVRNQLTRPQQTTIKMPSLIAFGAMPPVLVSSELAFDALNHEMNSPSATGVLFPFGRLAAVDATATVESDAAVEDFDTLVDDIVADSHTAVDNNAGIPDENVVWTMADTKRADAIDRAAAHAKGKRMAEIEVGLGKRKTGTLAILCFDNGLKEAELVKLRKERTDNDTELLKLRRECYSKGQAIIRLNDSRPRREAMQNQLDLAMKERDEAMTARVDALTTAKAMAGGRDGAIAKLTKIEEVATRLIESSRTLEERVVYLDGQVTYFKEKEREKSRKVDKLVCEVRGLREGLNRVVERGWVWAETVGTLAM